MQGIYDHYTCAFLIQPMSHTLTKLILHQLHQDPFPSNALLLTPLCLKHVSLRLVSPIYQMIQDKNMPALLFYSCFVALDLPSNEKNAACLPQMYCKRLWKITLKQEVESGLVITSDEHVWSMKIEALWVFCFTVLTEATDCRCIQLYHTVSALWSGLHRVFCFVKWDSSLKEWAC